jgi:hypothetical protein
MNGNMSLEVPSVVNIKIMVFWVMMLCSLTGRCQYFERIYPTVWHHIPGDCSLQKLRCLLRVLRLVYMNIPIYVVVVKNIYIFFFQVLLTNTCPFQLDDKTFKLLTDVFLFYDLSVYGFIQHYKVRILELNSYSQFSVIKVVYYHNHDSVKCKESSQ